MSNTVLFGAQWGDEGKGKIIDVLTMDADWVVRYQGGNNAGHTVEIEDQKYILHLTPSGILRNECKCVIGNGLVIDVIGLKKELENLLDRGIILENRLFISDRAHIVFPYHKALDGAKENKKSNNGKIGTTKRGIGPTYSDKADRTGIRMGEISDSNFKNRVIEITKNKNEILTSFGEETLDQNKLLEDILSAVDFLKPYICDTIPLLHKAMNNNEKILFEGAQGIMLDIDFGTYPFVTSSNTGTGGVSSGTGVPPQSIDRVIGIIKAYTTRVGGGPFPTELLDTTGEQIASVGNEFGATTGRPRRCGWFDAVVARYAVMIGGINEWSLMKLDVLDGLEKINVCTGYEVDGKKVDYMPGNINLFSKCKPIYKELNGWMEETTKCKTYDDLPKKAKDFIEYIEKITSVKVSIISVGPKRSSTIFKK